MCFSELQNHPSLRESDGHDKVAHDDEPVHITMRKKLLFVLLIVFDYMYMHAQVGGFEHMMYVKKYPNWGKGYLTVTDNGFVFFKTENDQYKADCITMELLNGDIPEVGDVIIEVDKASAYGWTEQQFYNIIDDRGKDSVCLKVKHRTNGGIVERRSVVRCRKTVPDVFKMFYDISLLKHGRHSSYYEFKGDERQSLYKSYPAVYEERRDNDFDFFEAMTYDYVINSDDPLFDKELLNTFISDNFFTTNKFQTSIGYTYFKLLRNEDNPDVIFVISRDVNENISTTYVPPTSRTINTGSTTTAKYNFITERYDRYETQQTYKTVREGGYVQETRTADLYLQIVALDAKKINDPNQTYPPIVWQATSKGHLVNSTYNPNRILNVFASFTTFLPIESRLTGAQRQTVYASLGANSSPSDRLVIGEIQEGSMAEEIGLKVGDELLGIEIDGYRNKILRRWVKEDGWDIFCLEHISKTTVLKVRRNGQKMEFVIKPTSIVFHRFWLG